MIRVLALVGALLGALVSAPVWAANCGGLVGSFCFQVPSGVSVVEVKKSTPGDPSQFELVAMERRSMSKVEVVIRVGVFRSSSGKTIDEYVERMYRDSNNPKRELLVYAGNQPHDMTEALSSVSIAGVTFKMSIANYTFNLQNVAPFRRQKVLVWGVLPDGTWLLIRWWNRADVPLASYINSLIVTARIVPPSS